MDKSKKTKIFKKKAHTEESKNGGSDIFECLPSHKSEQTILNEELYKETMQNDDKVHHVVKDILFSKSMSSFTSMANVEFVRKSSRNSLYQEVEQNLQLYPLSYRDKQKKVKTQYFIHQQSRKVMLARRYKCDTMFLRMRTFTKTAITKPEVRACLLESTSYSIIKHTVYHTPVLCSLDQLLQAKFFTKQAWTEPELLFILSQQLALFLQLRKNGCFFADWKPQNIVFAFVNNSDNKFMDLASTTTTTNTAKSTSTNSNASQQQQSQQQQQQSTTTTNSSSNNSSKANQTVTPITLKLYGLEAGSFEGKGFNQFNGFTPLYAPKQAQQEFFDGSRQFQTEQQRVHFELFQIGRTMLRIILPLVCSSEEEYEDIFRGFLEKSEELPPEVILEKFVKVGKISEELSNFILKTLLNFQETTPEETEAALQKFITEVAKPKITTENSAQHYQAVLDLLFAECRKHNIETIPLKRLTKDVLRCIRYGIASLQQDMMVTCVDRMSDGLAKRPDEEKEQLKKIILGCHSFFEKYKQLFIFIKEIETEIQIKNFTPDQQFAINYYIGNSYMEKQKYYEALPFFKAAFENRKKENKFNDDCAEMMLELTKLYVCIHNTKDAKDVIDQYQNINRETARCPRFNAGMGQIYLLASYVKQAADTLTLARNFQGVERDKGKIFWHDYLYEIMIKKMLSESQLFLKNYEDAESNIKQCIDLCKSEKIAIFGPLVQNTILIVLQFQLGITYYLQKRNRDGEQNFKLTIDLIKQEYGTNTALLKMPNMTLGELFMVENKPVESEKHYKDAIESHYKDKLLKEDVELARCCYYLAKQLHLQLKYKEAEFFYTKAVGINNHFSDTEVRVGSYINLGILYTRFADLNKAEQFLMQVNEYMRFNPEKCPNYNESLVILYTLKNQFEKAHEYTKKALAYAEETKGKESAYLIALFYHLAYQYKQFGKLQEAKYYSDKAYDFTAKYNYAYQDLQRDDPDFFELVKTLKHYGIDK